MDRRTDEILGSVCLPDFDVLEISGHKWAQLGCKSFVGTDYPGFDVSKDQLPNKFDLIIAEQVWEHIEDPRAATLNVFSMLRPGGYFFLATPFLLRRHDVPVDVTRWTAFGLQRLLASCGFDTNSGKFESWGNKECVIANLDAWVFFDPNEHSLHNDERFPVTVWGFAQKPAFGD